MLLACLSDASSLGHNEAQPCRPKPVRKPGECLVKIKAASVNPVDTKTRAGAIPSFLIAKPKARYRDPPIALRLDRLGALCRHGVIARRHACLAALFPRTV